MMNSQHLPGGIPSRITGLTAGLLRHLLSLGSLAALEGRLFVRQSIAGLVLVIAIVVVAVAVLIMNIKRSYAGVKDQTHWLAWTRLISGIFILALSFLSTGELLTPALRRVGVVWWKPAAYLIFVELIVSILILYIPAGIRALMNRRDTA